MRIGIEAQHLLNPHKHETDITALELIQALQQIDHVNTYFIFVCPGENKKFLTIHSNFTLVSVPGVNSIYWEQVALPKALRTYQLDVLHCTSNIAPRLTGVPLIVTLHDVLFLRQTSGINTASAYQRFGDQYRTMLVGRLINRSSNVLTVSRFAAQQIKEALNIPKAQIDVLYNGVSNRFNDPVTHDRLASVRKAYQLPDRYFFFFGSTDPRKNSKNVLQAFIKYGRTNPGISLIISGELSSLIKPLLTTDEYAFVQERCQFIGTIHNDDLPALYTLAEVFLFPSISEEFGLPILEAMACGTPVITSTLTAMPEIAGDAALLVDPHQPQSIAEAMHQLVDKSLLRQLLIRRGKERVAHFSWKHTAQQLLATYKTHAPAAQNTRAHAYSIVY
ncbi:glycosyltransferase family 4 protein [Spirosoma flavum]|uniref:Glycosyltransferase family 4 protein n=1 Tax=Spirosoma flavum TaxID=2048557 RepID=A0ABW6AEB0_9BACT